MALKEIAQNNKESMIIYKLTNLVNGKIYIGQTTWPFNSRWSAHCCPSANTQIIDRAIKKYGKTNFKTELVEQCETLDQLNEKEIYWVDFYNARDRKIGYNIKPGGKNSTHSQETIDKILATRKKSKELGLIPDPWNKGQTSETNSTIRETALQKKGQKRNKQTCEKMSNARKGRTYESLYGEKANEILESHRRKSLERQKVQVNQFDINMQLIQTFEYMADALKFVGILRNGGQIAQAIKNKKFYRNFYWEYK